MSHPYKDIIHLPHPTSRRHARMTEGDRAAQFAPFAALTGYEDAVNETARLTDSRIFLAEDGMADLDARQQILRAHIHQRPVVTVTYFCPDQRKAGGAYHTVTGQLLKMDSHRRTLVVEETEISLEDILRLESELFEVYL